MSEVIELNADNFEEEVLKSDKPVMVDFYSTYCGPCRALAQVVGWVAAENEDAKVCKLNVDEAQDFATKYGINAVPTIVFFKDGEEKNRLTGVQAKCKLNNELQGLK